MSQRETPTEAGKLNRRTEEQKGRRENSGTSAEFGQNIGRSENLSEGGQMKNRTRNDDQVTSREMGNENEPSRRPAESSYGSSSGRSGIESELDRDQKSGDRDRNRGSSVTGERSSGRH